MALKILLNIKLEHMYENEFSLLIKIVEIKWVNQNMGWPHLSLNSALRIGTLKYA